MPLGGSFTWGREGRLLNDVLDGVTLSFSGVLRYDGKAASLLRVGFKTWTYVTLLRALKANIGKREVSLDH